MSGTEAFVIYDGECGLCCRSVNWLAARDHAARLRFVPARSEAARHLLAGRRPDVDPLASVALVEGSNTYQGSTAVLQILAKLPAPWRLLRLLLFVPGRLREPAYRFAARNRHRLAGGHSCPAPDPRFRERFLA